LPFKTDIKIEMLIKLIVATKVIHYWLVSCRIPKSIDVLSNYGCQLVIRGTCCCFKCTWVCGQARGRALKISLTQVNKQLLPWIISVHHCLGIKSILFVAMRISIMKKVTALYTVRCLK